MASAEMPWAAMSSAGFPTGCVSRTPRISTELPLTEAGYRFAMPPQTSGLRP